MKKVDVMKVTFSNCYRQDCSGLKKGLLDFGSPIKGIFKNRIKIDFVNEYELTDFFNLCKIALESPRSIIINLETPDKSKKVIILENLDELTGFFNVCKTILASQNPIIIILETTYELNEFFKLCNIESTVNSTTQDKKH